MSDQYQTVIRAEFLDKIEVLIRELEGNPNQHLKSVGITSSQLRNHDSYLPYEAVATLLENCSKALNSPLFGIQLAQIDTSSKSGIVNFSLSLKENLRELHEQSQLVAYLQTNALKRGLVIKDTTTYWEINQLNPRLDSYDQINLCHLQRVYNEISERLPLSCNLKYFKIHTKMPHKNSNRYNTNHIIFNENINAISLPTSWLNLNLLSVSHYAENISNKLLNQLKVEYPDNLITMIQSTMIDLLPAGDCTVENIANTLGISVRKIQLQLKDNGTSYSELLRDCRLDKACELLKKPTETITDISLQLGFSNSSTFSRTFKEWTTLSPKDWRKINKTP